LHLELFVDGQLTGAYDFEQPSEAGLHRLDAALPATTAGAEAIEVLLRTDSYFTRIRDPRMRSFQLISARVE
jgi:hypothetical protein